MRGRAWTPEERAFLETHPGLTAKQTGEMLGRTAGAVWKYRSHIGLLTSPRYVTTVHRGVVVKWERGEFRRLKDMVFAAWLRRHTTRTSPPQGDIA